MFRVTRLILQKRIRSNASLLSQHGLPKQMFVELSVVPGNKEKSEYRPEENFRNRENLSNIGVNNLENILKDFTIVKKNDKVLRDVMRDSMNYNSKDVIRVLKVMAETGTRSTDCLDYLCNVILKNNWAFSLFEISDILYSFARLSYRNERVIGLVTDSLKAGIEFPDIKAISSILHSIGIMRYRDCALLDSLLQVVLKQPFDIQASVGCLMTLSFLNYSSNKAEPLIKFLSDLKETDFYQAKDFINFIWSCAILNKLHLLPPNLLSELLSEKFLEKLVFPYYHTGIKLKLLNIRAAIEMFLQDSKSLSNSNYNKFKIKLEDRKSSFFKSVAETVAYILPKPGYFTTLVDTNAGFLLDVKYYINSQNSPVQLTKAEKNTKMGILLLDYKELCSDDTPTGIFAFKLRVLQHQGYKVVVLHHAEFPANASLSKKISFTREKLSQAVGWKKRGTCRIIF